MALAMLMIFGLQFGSKMKMTFLKAVILQAGSSILQRYASPFCDMMLYRDKFGISSCTNERQIIYLCYGYFGYQCSFVQKLPRLGSKMSGYALDLNN